MPARSCREHVRQAPGIPMHRIGDPRGSAPGGVLGLALNARRAGNPPLYGSAWAQSTIVLRRRGAAEANRVVGCVGRRGLARIGADLALWLGPRATAHNPIAAGFWILAAIGWIVG